MHHIWFYWKTILFSDRSLSALMQLNPACLFVTSSSKTFQNIYTTNIFHLWNPMQYNIEVGHIMQKLSLPARYAIKLYSWNFSKVTCRVNSFIQGRCHYYMYSQYYDFRIVLSAILTTCSGSYKRLTVFGEENEENEKSRFDVKDLNVHR